MSVLLIRQVLEGQLNSITPSIETSWEKERFKPKHGVPYQKPVLLFGTTENPVMGSSMYREIGIFQVTLAYPSGYGSADIEARASLIKSTFKRGTTLSKSGVNVIIDRTPSILSMPDSKDRSIVTVKIRFYSEIFI